jgi:hypothetical protein
MLKLNRQPRTNEDAETTRWYMQIAQAVNALVDKVTANDGPAFSAYQSVAQSIPANVLTKVSLQSEEFDTANAFSSGTVVTNGDTTNRFTPQVAGYYQFNAAVGLTTTTTSLLATIYKNGSEYKRGALGGISSLQSANVSALIYLNGSTDYVELFIYQNIGSAVNTQASQATVNFQGFLARAA